MSKIPWLITGSSLPPLEATRLPQAQTNITHWGHMLGNDVDGSGLWRWQLSFGRRQPNANNMTWTLILELVLIYQNMWFTHDKPSTF